MTPAESFEQISHTSSVKDLVRPHGSLDVKPAQEHLDSAPSGYLEAINEVDPEELVKHVEKVGPLLDYAPNAGCVVSVGVGSGLELRALRHLYPDASKTRIIGLDLSMQAIASAIQYLKYHNVLAELIHGSALNMPFRTNGQVVDGLVFSAILHEVYSYVPDGRRAWKLALQEAFQNLAPGGVLVLRDFAAPEKHGPAEVQFISDEAIAFYDYFRQRYRTFETWETDDVKAMHDRRVTFDDFPPATGGKVILEFRDAAEMMLHFRNYIDHIERGILVPGDTSWKEIDECYLVPQKDEMGVDRRMAPADYAREVLKIGCESLGGSTGSVVLLRDVVAERPDTAEFLQYHFGITMEGVEKELTLFRQIPRKMEYAFRKS